jgi:Holliday junction resolvase
MNRQQKRKEIPRMIDGFCRELQTYSIESGLTLCTAVSQNLVILDEHWLWNSHSLHTLWFTAFLAKELLIGGREKGGITMTQSDFDRLSRDYAVISDVAETIATSKGPNGLAGFMRIQYERGAWQQPIFNLIPRIYLSLIRRPDSENYVTHSWLLENIASRYGMPFEDLFRVTLGLYASFAKHGKLNLQYLTGTSDPFFAGWFSNDKLQKCLDNFGCDVTRFREEQGKFRIPDIVSRPYEFNYLHIKPIIRLSSGEVLCPLPVILPDRLATGVYFDVAEQFEEAGIGRDKFTAAYGQLFEAYVGLILSQVYERGKSLVSAAEYLKDCGSRSGQQPSIPDWIIFEGDFVVLVECKSGKLPARIVVDRDVKAFQRFVVDNYLNQGRTQFDYLSEHFVNKRKHVRTAIVYNDHISMYNDFQICLSDHTAVARKLIDLKCVFVSISELEEILPMMRQGRPFGNMIDEFITSTHQGDTSFGGFAHKNCIGGCGRLELMTNTYREIMGKVPPSWN